MSPTFHPDAVMVELRRHQDGWFVWFVRPHVRDFEFFTRGDVGEDIDARALNNEGNVVRYMESSLKAVGYKGLSRRPTVVGDDVAAVWDVSPTNRHKESPGSSLELRSRPLCPQCGHDLTSSLMNPQGTDTTGVLYQSQVLQLRRLAVRKSI